MSEAFPEITRAEAPHLHAALDDLCHKAGIAKPILCRPPVSMRKLHFFAGAMHLDTPRIVVGDGMRRILGHHMLGDGVNEELKAVLAHEVGHLKHQDVALGRIIPLRLSPILAMTAAAVGLMIHDHLKKSTPDGIAEQDRKQYLDHQLNGELHEMQKQNPWLRDAMPVIRYAAAGALGLIGGTLASKLMHNHIEFRADRVSAELMGSGKPLANALQKVTEFAERYKPTDKKFDPIKDIINWIEHPDTQVRIDHLRAM